MLQKNVLFTGSISDNLRWGDKEATDEECIQACKLACADEFIERFPDKYNTHIEQGRKQWCPVDRSRDSVLQEHC